MSLDVERQQKYFQQYCQSTHEFYIVIGKQDGRIKKKKYEAICAYCNGKRIIINETFAQYMKAYAIVSIYRVLVCIRHNLIS